MIFLSTEEDWEIPNTMYEETLLYDLNLDHFGTQLDIVDEVLILKRRIMTRAQKNYNSTNLNKHLVKIRRDS